MDFKVLFCSFFILHLVSFYGNNAIEDPRFTDRLKPNFKFPLRLPHNIALEHFTTEDVVIRTFPTEVNLFRENAEYTKNMSLELESSCGYSKSMFDEKDVVMLTLIEQDIDNVTSKIVKSIEIDPFSVDFYPHKITMEPFKKHVQRNLMDFPTSLCINFYCEYYKVNRAKFPQFTFRDLGLEKRCASYESNNCTFVHKEVDYPRVLAETEKLIRAMKYLRLFDLLSMECNLTELQKWVTLEMDNKTASLFPKLTKNHSFIANFIDSKGKLSTSVVIGEYKIIPNR
ncbi:uncharacterized protein LOC107370982 [Tetranychus urticae]|uniref:Vitellogenin domain-containing protein n=1 Tax=Tetranychus urticae TaxID=32264 RepID=T1JWW7_TETUR|nr:uncharacterized protein LOC107370982 [Tetranychus urticae]